MSIPPCSLGRYIISWVVVSYKLYNFLMVLVSVPCELTSVLITECHKYCWLAFNASGRRSQSNIFTYKFFI